MPAIKLMIIIADVQHLTLQFKKKKITVVGWLIKQTSSASATITIVIVRGWRELADDYSWSNRRYYCLSPQLDQ